MSTKAEQYLEDHKPTEQQMQQQTEWNDDMTLARQILEDAGVDPNIIKTLVTHAIAALIVKDPNLATFWSQKYPASGYSDYRKVALDYGFPQTQFEHSGSGGADALVNAMPVHTNEAAGAKMLDNGVIISTNPSTGQETVLFPDDPRGQIAGSPAWLTKAQRSWGAKTVNTWEKRLISKGYLAEEGNGFNSDFRGALQRFHWDKYLGVPAPSVNGKGGAANEVQDAYDPVDIRQDVRETYRTVFGDDPSDEELKYWEQMVHRQVKKVIGKGGSPTHAAKKAQEGFAEAFLADPEVQLASDEADDIEENTRMRDSFLSLSQIVSPS